MSEIGSGTVKAVNERGFCFLRPDHETSIKSGGKDVFAHFREFQRGGLRQPEIGERYEFQIKMTQGGAGGKYQGGAVMLGFGKTKEKTKPNQAQAYAQFRTKLDEIIHEARMAGVWPHTLATYLKAHANNLNMAQVRR